MGVHGLWDLLAPVGRRVSIETLAGKRLAIDASIWMIQFMKAMRDEKGETVRNAHLLGFFRRICKLLFLRTKPVFVFDGATPALKRRTVVARRRQRENAQTKIRKTAEKMLVNQVRAMGLKKLAENLKDQKAMNNCKGKEVMLDQSDTLERNNTALEGHNQEMVDEMLAASILAEESGGLDSIASTSAGAIGNNSGDASAAAFPTEDEDEDEDDEETIMPVTDGNVDPAVLAALPPSMQLDLLVQMRERLMAENRQKYQKVNKAPQKFSELQIEAYLKTVAFRREIDKVQKAAAGNRVGGVQTSRIASEANREFIFSSSFSGDKKSLASGGTEKNPEKKQREEIRDSSLDILNVISSAIKSSPGAEPVPNESVQTFLDKRGYTRVSRRRAMGIRMTRDLQRNIDLLKELEQERTTANSTEKAEIKIDAEKSPLGKVHCEGQIRKAVDDFNGDDFQNLENSLAEAETHKDELVLKSETCIKISFDDDGENKSLDAHDEFFTRLVAGNPVRICSGNNSGSDCEWEEGIIGKESGNLIDGNKLETNYLHSEEGNKSESDVEWEEGFSLSNDNKQEMESFHVEDRKENEVGVQWQGATTYAHGDAQELSVDVHKAVSKGSAEEDAALQEAIRRSLEDLKDEITGNVTHTLEKYSPEPSSQLGNIMNDNEPPLLFTTDSDGYSSVAGKRQPNASKETSQGNLSNNGSSIPTHISGRGLSDSLPITLADDMTNNKVATPMCNSSKVSDIAIGKRKMSEEDICLVGAQERVHDVETFASKDKDDTIELVDASVEDELLVLGEEYKTLREEQKKLERNADSVNSEMFVECQELLQMFGLPYIIAPMEAEAQCAYMELSNLVDGVVTDDSDVFLFGARSVYKNIFDDRKYVETYFMKDIESELGLNREKLIRMALLLGSDYTEGVSGIGIVNAIEVVNAFPEVDGFHKFREWIESPDPTILGPGFSSKRKGSKASINGTKDLKSDTPDCNSLQENEDNQAMDSTKQIFMDKHRNVSKNWHIPASFPSDAVISAYTAPQVDKSTESFTWGKPDIFPLRRLCWERFGWASQKADELLLPVLKEYNKHETQLRLEAFYTFNERFAKVRSKRIKQALKGITGRQSLESANNDDLQEGPGKTNKRRASSSAKKSKREEPLKKRAARSSKSGQKRKDPEEGLSSEGGRKRGRGRAVGRGGRKEISDSELDDTSTHNISDDSNDEREHQVRPEVPDSIRRSKRARKATNYLEKDEESDEPTHDEHKLTNSQSGCRDDVNGGLSEDDYFVLKGGGFCADEDEHETGSNQVVDSIPSKGSPVSADVGDYLQMGGGFCVVENEDDQDFQGRDNISVTLDKAEEDGGDTLRKSPGFDTKLNPTDQCETTIVNRSNVVGNIKDDGPTSVNAFSGIPFLKRKRRKR